MNYTFLSDFCTIYRIPKIQEKLNTLYPNFDQKYHIPELKWPGIPYTQNPWPGLYSSLLKRDKTVTFLICLRQRIPIFGYSYFKFNVLCPDQERSLHPLLLKFRLSLRDLPWSCFLWNRLTALDN